MSEKGWIKIDRSILDHWIYKKGKFDKCHAWIDLLLIADHKDHKNPYKGEVVTYKRGSVNISILALSQRWGWSREKTKRFLNELENDGMLRVNATRNRTTITLVNYGVYQDKPTTNKATNRQLTDNQPTTNKSYLKNDKNDKNEKKEVLPAAESVDEDEERFRGLTDDEITKILNSEGWVDDEYD